jgi:hypothetical protein
MRKLTEAQAWREIARRIEAQGKMDDGLCHEATKLCTEGAISNEVRNRMQDRTEPYVNESGGACYIHAGDEGDWSEPVAWRNVRILIALLIAEHCDDEARAA